MQMRPCLPYDDELAASMGLVMAYSNGDLGVRVAQPEGVPYGVNVEPIVHRCWVPMVQPGEQVHVVCGARIEERMLVMARFGKIVPFEPGPGRWIIGTATQYGNPEDFATVVWCPQRWRAADGGWGDG